MIGYTDRQTDTIAISSRVSTLTREKLWNRFFEIFNLTLGAPRGGSKVTRLPFFDDNF